MHSSPTAGIHLLESIHYVRYNDILILDDQNVL